MGPAAAGRSTGARPRRRTRPGRDTDRPARAARSRPRSRWPAPPGSDRRPRRRSRPRPRRRSPTRAGRRGRGPRRCTATAGSRRSRSRRGRSRRACPASDPPTIDDGRHERADDADRVAEAEAEPTSAPDHEVGEDEGPGCRSEHDRGSWDPGPDRRTAEALGDDRRHRHGRDVARAPERDAGHERPRRAAAELLEAGRRQDEGRLHIPGC